MSFRFGPFEIDERRYELRQGGEPVALPPRSFDLLLMLVRRHGELVTKSELMAAVWPEVSVTKDALPQAMLIVRRALGDTLGHPRFIQTVRGRGYRFIAEVDERESGNQLSPSSSHVVEDEALDELFARARLHPGSVVVLTGKSGADRKRLVEMLCARSANALVIVVSDDDEPLEDARELSVSVAGARSDLR